MQTQAPDPKIPPLAERRPAQRKRTLLGCTVAYAQGRHSFPCTIRNLSREGARIAFAAGQPLPSDFWLINGRDGAAHRAAVSWASDREAGLRLEAPVRLDAVPQELRWLRRFLGRVV